MISKRKSRAFVTLVALSIGGLLGVNNSYATSATTISESNANQTITVKSGSTVSLSLHSMYWNLGTVKSTASLKEKGDVVQKPIMPGAGAPAGCGVPGSGCGVQTWKFSAVKIGITHLVASRTSCGEAMRCTGTNGSFKVTVKVVK